MQVRMAPNKRPRFPAFSRVAKGKEPLVGSCPSSDDDETQDPNVESPYRPAFEENDTISHSQYVKGFSMPPPPGWYMGWEDASQRIGSTTVVPIPERSENQLPSPSTGDLHASLRTSTPGLDMERPQPQVVGRGEVRTIGMF
jgi:hypothetical protein